MKSFVSARATPGPSSLNAVWGHVDVRCREEVVEFRLTDEAVVEDHVGLDTKLATARLQHPSIRLALPLPLPDVGVSGAQDDVDRVREALDDGRQRVDHVLDAFVGREQPEGEDHPLTFHADARLAGIASGEHRNPVGDQIDLARGNPVNAPKQLDRVFAHDHEAIGERDQLVHDRALIVTGLREDGVQRRDDGHAQLTQKRDQVGARTAPEDPVLVLDADHVDGVDVQEVGGAAIGSELALLDLEAHRVRVVVPLSHVVHRQDEAIDVREVLSYRLAEVRRERGDSALARQVIADHRDLADRG
ncbi:hypothetical protein Poly30_17510 [Planctomycetes bacterium Poly30]|uniref:Uncharacterized protein n=1 Tax=Saltatorellus ferox TaxID=2528018 RepID=A0A518EQ82_9BACT|nr:hypothetical protein Poly30_17510 [Planctomycetes bacterium Poly30]